jgi:hypothetical protein
VPRRDREHARDSNDDLLSQVVMERMLAGVATRRHARGSEPVGDDLDAQARSTSGSSVSRRFKAATDAQLDELLSRDRSELDLAGLMLDGVHLADSGACCTSAATSATISRRTNKRGSIACSPPRSTTTIPRGEMIKRWCAAGMLNAERGFRRLKGYRQMPTLVVALARHVEAVPPACDAAPVASADQRTPHRPVVATSKLDARDDLGPKS